MLRGELVNLRPVEPTDGPILYRWLNDPEVMRGWGLPEAVVSLAESQRRIEAWLREEAELGRPAALIVESLEHGPVGLVVRSGLRPRHRAVELSLLIGETGHWGSGLGGDALQTIAGACFAQWNLHRVQLRCEAANDRARRLYERCGFTHEATLRQASWYDGAYRDVLVFGLLATDPAARELL